MEPIDEAIQASDESEFILQHPRFKAAWEAVDKAIDETFLEANVHDEATRRECQMSRKNLRRLRAIFETAIANGFVAKESLRRSQLQKARDFLGI